MRRGEIVLAGVIDDKSRNRHICFLIVVVERNICGTQVMHLDPS